MIKLFIVLVVFGHWQACLWGLVSSYMDDPNTVTWITVFSEHFRAREGRDFREGGVGGLNRGNGGLWKVKGGCTKSRTGWARRGSGRQQPVAMRRQHKVLNNIGTYLGTYYRDTDAWEIYWGGTTSTEKKLASPAYSRNKYD